MFLLKSNTDTTKRHQWVARGEFIIAHYSLKQDHNHKYIMAWTNVQKQSINETVNVRFCLFVF